MDILQEYEYICNYIHVYIYICVIICMGYEGGIILIMQARGLAFP